MRFFAVICAVILSLMISAPAFAGWKTNATLFALGYAAKKAPVACMNNPACVKAIEQSAISLVKKYGIPAVKNCLGSDKCLGLIVGASIGTTIDQNKEELAEWFTSYMGKGKGREFRQGNDGDKDSGSPNEPEPDDDKELFTLQTGGNTLTDRTAQGLNRKAGRNLKRRDWGKALENLKAENKISAKHHGLIRSDGAYLDKHGNLIGYIEDFLF